MTTALVLGRFHAVTRAQADWLASLATAPIDRIVCVLTSANHAGTRRNPLDAAQREGMLRPALERAKKPFDLVRIDDIPDSDAWVDHVVEQVRSAVQVTLTHDNTRVYSANHDVCALFEAKGFGVVAPDVKGLTPQELVQRVVDGVPWEAEASEETRAVYTRADVVWQLRSLFSQSLLNDDGELGHRRDFASYGAQMDASLRQKLEDLVRWVKPGSIVDKGCGTGQLLVALSRLFPDSHLVGVDLSREFLRLCDENTYATDDVEVVFGNIIDRTVPLGSASSVIFSSVMHEVHSYSGYDLTQIDRALRNAFDELAPGGHVLVRDGVSPPVATWRLSLLTPETRTTFERFAAEFRQGRGVSYERLGEHEVRLSAHDANEFLCKKDYQKNWHIEVHEEFGPLTLVGWGEALSRAGFDVLHLAEYANPWIVEHRYEGTVALTDDAGQRLPWPPTNCVVVGRKPRAIRNEMEV